MNYIYVGETTRLKNDSKKYDQNKRYGTVLLNSQRHGGRFLEGFAVKVDSGSGQKHP